MQVETIYTFKNYLYVVKSDFLSQNKVEKICLISWGHFAIKQLALVDDSMIRASLAVYHLISNARSWNNC